jgi:hypothetical protein
MATSPEVALRRGRKPLGEDKKVALHLNVSPAVKAWLEQQALAQERSVSYVAEKLLAAVMIKGESV